MSAVQLGAAFRVNFCKILRRDDHSTSLIDESIPEWRNS